MSDILVITTFHQPGLDEYGQRFIDSFAQRVDKRIKLIVYAESCTPNNPDPQQITIFDSFVLSYLSIDKILSLKINNSIKKYVKNKIIKIKKVL